MASHTYTIQLNCAENGCGEWSFFGASTRAEEREIREQYAKHPYRCFRHRRPNEVLSAANVETTKTLVVEERLYRNYRGEQKPLGFFWTDGSQGSGNGVSFGPGFRAIAKDFPPGTTLIVTARIVLPEDAEQ